MRNSFVKQGIAITKSATTRFAGARKNQTRLLAVICLLTIAFGLSTTISARTDNQSAAATPANGFAIQQPIFAAGFWDFFSFLGFDWNAADANDQTKPTGTKGGRRFIESKPNPDNPGKPEYDAGMNAASCAANGVTRNVPSQYATIQEAINASSFSNRDTIQIAAGTYSEQIIVNKCVNIVGSGQTGANATIIQAPAMLALSSVPSVNAASIVEVRANSTVTMSNLTVSGPVVFPAGSDPNNPPAAYGVFVVENAALQMTDVTVTKIRKEPLDGTQNGIAVRAGSVSANQTGALDFTRVTVSDYQKSGIIVSNNGSTGSFKDGLVMGVGATPAIGQNGFEIVDGATATITNNTIAGNLCNNANCGADPVNQSQSAGIIVIAAGQTTINGNTISNNDAGYLSQESTTAIQQQVTGNTFVNNRYFGLFLQGSTLIKNNFISGGNIGASVLSLGSGFDVDNSIADFQNDSITGASQSGIQLFDGDQTDTFTPQVNVNFTRLAGSGGANLTGIDNQTTSTVTADNDFWGCNGGPNGGAGCDQAVGSVTAASYLVLSRTTTSAASVAMGGTATITTNLRFNNLNQDTYTATTHLPNPIPATATSANSPGGIPVNFTATNGTVNPTVTPLVDGLASTTFTGGAVDGGDKTAIITAQVDNAADTVNVTVLDTIAPTGSITNGSFTAPNLVNYTVTFSEAVTGIDAGDFNIAVVSGNVVSSITNVSCTGNVCTVQITVTSGMGSIRLDLVDNDSIVDTAGTPNPLGGTGAGNGNASGNVVAIDIQMPSVTIDLASGQTDPTSTSPINFAVVFDEPVTGFDASDVTATSTGTGTLSVIVTNPSADNKTFNVAVSGMTSSGDVSITFAAGAATDADGNASNAPTIIDNTVTFTLVDTPVTVNPTNTNTTGPTMWFGFDDNTDTVIQPSYVEGPTGQPLGIGSSRIRTSDTGKYLFANNTTYQGTRFDQITELSYSEYANNPGNVAKAPSLQLGADFDLNDADESFQGRLVFEPYQNPTAPNQPLVQGTWQRWNATNGKFYTSRATILGNPTLCPQSAPCTRTQLLAAYPNVGIHRGGLGLIGFRGEGSGSGIGFEGNVDALTVGVNSANTTFNFEPAPPSISINDASAVEGGTVTFTVTQSVISQLDTTFTVNTSDGTATTADNDYAAITNQTVTIPANSTTVTVSVTTNADANVETDETFTVSLTNSVNAAIADGQGDGTILNDDISVMINQALGQADPTNTSPINFTVVFSEAVTGFDGSDVVLSGTAGATTAVVTGSGTTYNVAVSGMTQNGTVIATIAAGGATGANGTNSASTSTDNMVTYDTIAPTVTVNQAAGQPDPTNVSPINFTAVFSEVVTGFDAADVSTAGSTATIPAANIVVTNPSSDGKTFNIAVSPTTSGFVTISIPANAAVDAANNGNTASTSMDNTVTFFVGAIVIAVDDDGMANPFDCDAATPSFMTIQSAITAASAGNTIKVCPGVYPELVNVNKSLTINGAQAGVNAGTRTTLPAAESVVTGKIVTGTTRSSAFYASVNNVTIDGFTAQDNTNPNQFGTGILVKKGVVGTQLLNNIIQNNIIGIIPTTDTTISGNLIRNNNQPGPTGGTGIYAEAAANGNPLNNLTITNNTISGNNNVGILLDQTGGTTNNNTISNNMITGNGNALVLFGLTSTTITGNTIMNSAGSQIFIGGNSSGLNINCNSIVSTPSRGVNISGTGNSNILVNNNNFISNQTAGVSVASGSYTGNLNAMSNYWGAPDGPGPVGPGSGDKVSAGVDFSNFLTSPSNCAPTPPPTVTINQAAGQNDPTSTSPITFTVVFSEPVSGFDASDVIVSGSAFGTGATPVVTVTPVNGTTYTVTVSGMNQSGTVTARIPAGAATRADGANVASTSMDNTVFFNFVAGSGNVIQPVNPVNITAQQFAFVDESINGGTASGAFVTGPAGQPLGVGSAQLTINDNGRISIATNRYAGTRLADITALKYDAYTNRSDGATINLSFDVDYDLSNPTTVYQNRLVYIPPTATPNTWQSFDTLAGTFYASGTSNPGITAGCTQATPCTVQQLLAAFPNVGILNSPSLFAGGLYLRIGGFPSGAVANADNLVVGVNGNMTTFDFEPSPPTISIGNQTVTEGNSGTTAATFTITQSQVSQLDTTVTINTADGSATVADNDYQPIVNGTATIPAGQNSTTVTVQVNGDTNVEGNETFRVNLSNALNAAIADPQGLGTINNDDVTVSFSSPTYSIGEAGGTATITVTRSGVTPNSVTVDYATSNGTATGGAACTTGVDFINTSGTLTFAGGDTTQTFTVTICDDNISEPPPAGETVNLTLSNPTGGATLGLAAATLTIIDNDGGGLVTISGNIQMYNAGAANTNLQGVTVTLSGSSSQTTTTDQNGNYSFTGLTAGGSYKVMPSGLGKIYDPVYRNYSSLTVNITNANFIAYNSINDVPRRVRFGQTTVSPGNQITVPVLLDALGSENGVSFSFTYDTTRLSNPVVTLGSDAAGATLITNLGTTGSVGVTIVQPPGQTFGAAGTKQIVNVQFNTAANTSANTPLNFTNSPITRSVNDVNANPLQAQFINGTVVFAQGLEADVDPRPNGDGDVDLGDFNQVGQFAAGLATPDFATTNEFQRADCEPTAQKGDGDVDLGDFIQAGRYAAVLDPVQPVGGPAYPTTVPPNFKAIFESGRSSAIPRIVTAANVEGSPGNTVTVAVSINAESNDKGTSFTMDYDNTKLSNPQVSLGSGGSGGFLVPNTNISGKVIVQLAYITGGFQAGVSQIILIQFTVANNASAGVTPLTFNDTPVERQVRDVNNIQVAATFQNGSVNILRPTAATVNLSGRLVSQTGSGISNALVTLTNGQGEMRTVYSNFYGNFNFANVPSEETYTIGIKSKRYTFVPQVVDVSGGMSKLLFIAEQ